MSVIPPVQTQSRLPDWSEVLRALQDLAKSSQSVVASQSSVAPPGPQVGVDVEKVMERVDEAARRLRQESQAAAERLFPATDYLEEAAKVLEARGVARPEPPEPFKVSPWQLLAAVGPVAGALVGGSPSLALQSAPATLMGVYGPHAQAMEQYEKAAAEYQKQLSEERKFLAEQTKARASALLPYFAMTADQVSRWGTDLAGLVRDFAQLDLNQKTYALNAAKHALDVDVAKWNRQQEIYRMVIDVVKQIDRQVGDALEREERARHNKAMEALEAARVEIARGHLGVAWANAKMAMAKLQKEEPRLQLEKLRLSVGADAFNRGDTDLAFRVWFGIKPDDMTESERMLVKGWLDGSIRKKTGLSPDQIEALRVKASEVMKRVTGDPTFEFPKAKEDPLLGVWKFILRQLGIE